MGIIGGSGIDERKGTKGDKNFLKMSLKSQRKAVEAFTQRDDGNRSNTSMTSRRRTIPEDDDSDVEVLDGSFEITELPENIKGEIILEDSNVARDEPKDVNVDNAKASKRLLSNSEMIRMKSCSLRMMTS